MLKAAKRNKSHHKRRLHEDEITSCFFGPLSYMGANDSLTFFSLLLNDNDKHHINNELFTDINEVSFEFWPNVLDNGRLEPDLLIHYKKDNDTLFSLWIEIKWNSGLNPPDELYRQWKCMSNEKRCLHLYIVKNIAKGFKDLSDNLIIASQNRLIFKDIVVCKGWNNIVAALTSIVSKKHLVSKQLLLWSEDAIAFLNELGIVNYSGFFWLDKVIIRGLSVNDEVVYWRHKWMNYGKVKIDNPSMIFWYQNKS